MPKLSIIWNYYIHLTMIFLKICCLYHRIFRRVSTYLRRGLHGNAFCIRICICSCICICFWCPHTCMCSLYLQINSSLQRAEWLRVGGLVRLCVCVGVRSPTTWLFFRVRFSSPQASFYPSPFPHPLAPPLQHFSVQQRVGRNRGAWHVGLALGAKAKWS